MFMTKEEAANCKEAAMPVESEAEYLVWSKVTKSYFLSEKSEIKAL